jgi:hypothetical protein
VTLTAKEVLAVVCERLSIPLWKVHHTKGSRAVPQVNNARMVAAFLMRTLLHMSLPETARALGLVSHKDVVRLLKILPERDSGRIMDLATTLWWELEQVDRVLHLPKKIEEFEKAVGLQWVR